MQGDWGVGYEDSRDQALGQSRGEDEEEGWGVDRKIEVSSNGRGKEAEGARRVGPSGARDWKGETADTQR